MRIRIIACVVSLALLAGGAALTALARDLAERPRDRCTMTFAIEAPN